MDKEIYGLSYAEFVVPMVKSTVEQQEIIQQQQTQIKALQSELQNIKSLKLKNIKK